MSDNPPGPSGTPGTPKRKPMFEWLRSGKTRPADSVSLNISRGRPKNEPEAEGNRRTLHRSQSMEGMDLLDPVRDLQRTLNRMEDNVGGPTGRVAVPSPANSDTSVHTIVDRTRQELSWDSYQANEDLNAKGSHLNQGENASNQPIRPRKEDVLVADTIVKILKDPLIQPDDRPAELLSKIYASGDEDLLKEKIQEYATRLRNILGNIKNATTGQQKFLTDYLDTIAKIEEDNAKTKKGLAEIDGALLKLPRSSQTTVKVNELVIKPEVFDGEKPRPRRWLQDYNEAIIANGWSDAIAIKYLPTFLVRSAKDWYFTEIKPKLKDDAKWYQICQAFNDNYLTQADYEQLRAAVDNAKQRPGESVSNYIPRMRRLLLLLTPGMMERDQLAQLRNKLRPEYRQLVALADPKTIQEFKKSCLLIEAGFPQRKDDSGQRSYPTNRSSNPRSRPKRRFNQTGGRSPNSKQGTRKPSTFRKNYRSKSQPAQPTQPKQFAGAADYKKDMKCYNCGRIGHLKSECWSKPKEAGNTRGRGRPVNIVQDDIDRTRDQVEVLTIKHKPQQKQSGLSPKYRLQELSKDGINLVVGGGKLLRHKVICNDVEINAVVDTGAYVSVIDESIVNHLNWDINQPALPLIGADGNLLGSKGSVNLTIELPIKNVTKKKVYQVAVVKDLTAPMLLGLELMKEFKVYIDTANLELRFDKPEHQGGVRVRDKEIIPPRCQAIVESNVNYVGTILTVPFQMESGLLVANVVTEVKGNKAPVLVMNPHNKDITLERGTQLACIEEFKDEPSVQVETVNRIIEFDDHKIKSKIRKNNSATQEKVCVGDQLTQAQIDQLMVLLYDKVEAFSLYGEIGKTTGHTHKIELIPGAEPIVEPLRRRAQIEIDETRRQVQELLKEGIVEESSSPWASAYVLVKKKNGEYRLCIDFRRLNSVTKKMVYPLPNIEECLDTLSGKRYFTQLDFKSGFWQIAMEESSKELTAFRTEDGLFQFKRMPFGLTNAPATFQRMINGVLAGLKGLDLQVFIDDICISTKTWSEHLNLLKSTLEAVIRANLKIKLDKCVFASDSIKFLGHEISEHGIRQDPSKLSALEKLAEPKDPKEVKRALGMFSYYRKFVPNFAMIVEPLTKLTRKNVSFVWGEEQQSAYQTIIKELLKNATLAHFNNVDPLLVKTDASRKGVAGMLLQRQDGDWKLITCCSRRLSDSENNYGITDLEGLALIYTVTKLRPYLLGREFKILVDHCALCVLNKQQPKSARLRRWAIVLSEFNFEIQYTKGNLHCDIDCLSRAPVDNPIDPYLEDKVYMVTPLDRDTWIRGYFQPDSRDIYQKAFDKEDDLKIVDEIVYKGDKMYVPGNMRFELARVTHVANINAHPGVAATVSKLKENYWWPNMQEVVTEVIKQCNTCVMQKPDRRRPAGTHQSFHVYQPGEEIAIDLIEKVVESTNGNSYIIVAIDMFTRYVDAKAVPDKGAPTFTQYLIEYCGRFGIPHRILTDSSTTFCNDFTAEIIKVFGANHVKSTPYHSQGNAVVERVNQTLEEKIRLVLDDPVQERNWDAALPIALLAINTTVHSSIGCTPYEMTFGRRPPLQDKNIVFQSSPHDLHAKLIKLYMRECYSNAIAIQATSQERAEKYYNSKRRSDLFQIGDFVAVEAPSRSSKFSPKFLGPFRVVGINKEIYTLENLKNNRTTERHVSSLRHAPAPDNDVALSVVAADHLFDRIQPIIYLKTKSKVSLGTARFDINFAYTSPCQLFRKHIAKDLELTELQQSNLDNFERSCAGLYAIEWLHEVDQLLSVHLPDHPTDHLIIPDRPYKEPRADRLLSEIRDYREMNKRGVAEELGYKQHQLARIIQSSGESLWGNSRRKRDTQEEKNATAVKYEIAKIPTDYKVSDIVLMVLCPICIPWISANAVERTYEENIERKRDQINKLLNNAKLTEFIKNHANTTKVKRGADYLREIDKELDLVNKTEEAKSKMNALRTVSAVLLGPIGSIVLANSPTEREEQLQEKWSHLKYLYNLMKNTDDLELFLLRAGREQKISKRSINEDFQQSLTLRTIDLFCPTFIFPNFCKENKLLREIKEMKELTTNWLVNELTFKLYEVSHPTSMESDNKRARNKRSIVSDIGTSVVSELFKQTLGVFTGNIVSNLVSTAVEIIYPNSNMNRIGRLETALEDMKHNIANMQQATRGILDNIDKLSNIVQASMKRLEEHIHSFPAYTWLASVIVTRMSQASYDLQRITDEAKKGRLAIEPLRRLTSLEQLRDIQSEDTQLLSISRVNNHTINIQFQALVVSPDTQVLKVHAFDHWDNLDATPELLKYTGADYLIYNDTSHCIRALPSLEDVVGEQCLDIDGKDPALNQWKVVERTEDIEKYANVSQVKKTISANYIYCFPGRILINDQQYRCPMEVFKLDSKYAFTTSQQKHVPSFYGYNATYGDYAVDVVHAGHFRSDSDVIQHLSLFESLRQEREKVRNLTQELSETVNIKRGLSWVYMIIGGILTPIVGTLAYAFVIYCIKRRITERLDERPRESHPFIARPKDFVNPPPSYPTASAPGSSRAEMVIDLIAQRLDSSNSGNTNENPFVKRGRI